MIYLTTKIQIQMLVSIRSICVSEGEDTFQSYYCVWKSFIDFPDSLAFEGLLTVQQIINTNSIICGNKAHELRKVNVYPSGYNTNTYSLFEKVEDELFGLIDSFNNKIDQVFQESDILSCYAFLFRKFLKIHPFLDGNGRIIKVIISKLYMYKFNYCMIWKHLDHKVIRNILSKNYIFEEFFSV